MIEQRNVQKKIRVHICAVRSCSTHPTDSILGPKRYSMGQENFFLSDCGHRIVKRGYFEKVYQNPVQFFSVIPRGVPLPHSNKLQYHVKRGKCKVNEVIFPSGC